MKADPYEGNRQEWPSYAFTLKAFIRRESPGLESYMTESEYMEEEITGRMVSDSGVDLEDDNQLGTF